MRRTRRCRPLLSLSLFPFLAVLICTMGVLIVLLVIVVKHADLRADEVKEQHSAKLQEQHTQVEILQEHDEVRIALLTDVRGQVNEDLRDRQQIRSNIQSHINELREQAEQLQARYLRLANLNSEADALLAANATQQIAALEAEIAAAEKQLNETSQEASQTQRSFAIVPYHGAGGTSRRPIFVECTANAIILQPYGIELTPEDFSVPLMAGNPLDAALLTIRDYLHSHSVDQKRPQAYPLLIVRPDGAVGYAMARRAMKSWVDQFGYELIPAEMQLTYPPPDDNLRQEIEKTIQAARIRTSAIRQVATRSISLAEIANNQYGSRSAEGNRMDAGPAILPTVGGARGSSQSSQLTNSGGNTRGNADFSGDGSPTAGNPHGDGQFEEQPDLIGQDGFSEHSSRSGTDAIGRGKSQEGSADFVGTGSNGSPVADASVLNTTPPSGLGPQGTGDDNAQFGNAPRPKSNDSAATFAANGDATFGTAQLTGSQAARAQQAEGAAGGQASQPGPQFGNASNQQAAAGQESGGTANLSSLSAQRGKDWALPDKTPNATVYRRLIFMQCSAQELKFRDVNRVQTGGEAIVFEKQTVEHVDELIDVVWRRVESWGVAGVRSYWKPQLMIEIQKGGEARAVEIQKLLEGSGLDVVLIGL